MSTLLRKVERVRLIPGSPGVPGSPASSYCTPAPPAGVNYVDCVIPGAQRIPGDSRPGARFFNSFWLPGCVYREVIGANGSACTGPFVRPDAIAITNPGLYYNCTNVAGGTPVWWRVTDEFGTRERVVPAPNPAPPRVTFVPFSPPPASIGEPPVLPPGTTSIGGGCYAVAAVPATPATFPRVVTEALDAWDSGAHSIVSHPRDCRLRFTVPDSIGAACGLTPESTRAAVDIERITHGFLISRNNGVPSVRVIERGAVRTDYIVAPVGTEVQVVRRGPQVVYFVGDGVQVYASTVPSTGPVKAAASLYAPGDTIG